MIAKGRRRFTELGLVNECLATLKMEVKKKCFR